MKEKLLQLENFVLSFPQHLKDYSKNLINNFYAAIDKLKNLSQTNYNLGIYHINNGSMNDAKLRFKFSIKLNPDFALAYYHLGRCYLFDLDFEKAKEAFEKALLIDKNLQEAKYRLDIINKTVSVTQIPYKVIEEDFDNFSSSYEDYVFKQLDYDAPKVLSEMLAKQLDKEDEDVDEFAALDIGCGTGLVGAYLRQLVSIKSLMGIDVSEKMLNLTKELEINNYLVYDNISRFNFEDYKFHRKEFDIVTACLSLSYNTNLKKNLLKIDQITSKNAYVGFAFLKAEKNDIEFDYSFAHFRFGFQFLLKLFKELNWNILSQKEIELFSTGEKGFLFVLQKL